MTNQDSEEVLAALSDLPTWRLPGGGAIRLITPEIFRALPDGTRLVAIDGEEVVKGRDYIDDDTRGGMLAYGFKVQN